MEWTGALAVMIEREALRGRPLAAGCDHDMEELPVIDLMIDLQCRRCGGLDTAPASAPSRQGGSGG